MKIVHLITGLNVGGAESMLHKLLTRLDRERFEIVVVSLLDAGPMGKMIGDLSIPVYSVGMKRGMITPRQFVFLWRLLLREQPLVLQTWMYHADLLGLLAGKMAGIRHVVWNLRRTALLPSASNSTALILKLCSILSRWPDAVIANSFAGRTYHASLGYRPRRWAVIPNGFDLQRFKPDAEARDSVRAELGICSEDLLIGTVGRYDPAKDHGTFLRAAVDFAGRYPDVSFFLAGRDVVLSNPELRAILDDDRWREKIHLLGERADVPRLMAALDIFTCSSRSEGFANVIGEAMACEVPCVVTDAGDSARIVGDTGLVVPTGDPIALANAWQTLLAAGPHGRRKLGLAARRRVRENYSLEEITRQYEQLYMSLSQN